MSNHSLCFEQKYKKKISECLSENFQFLVVKFSVHLNRRVFVMENKLSGDGSVLRSRLDLQFQKVGA